MGLIGWYFFALFGVLFAFLWTNLTNYKLPTARLLSSIAFLMLLWIFAKLMLVSGIGWESTRFWMLVMTAITWLLPAVLLHFVIEIKRLRSGKIYYYPGIFLTYLIPAIGALSFFVFPFFMPTKYIYIHQWVWDGIFLPAINIALLSLVIVYMIAVVGILLSEKYSVLDIGLILFAFLTFYLRFLLLFFDVAVYWSGWLIWQPLLVLLSYAFLWGMYKKHFWLEEAFSFWILDKILRNFSLPILIVRTNKTIWYINRSMSNLLSLPSASFSIEDCAACFENPETFLDIFRRLSTGTPTIREILRVHKEAQFHSFYAHAEVILLSRKLIAGYSITLTPLESEKTRHLVEKHIKLHKELEELHLIYQGIIQLLDIPIILMEKDWKIIEINQMVYKTLGINQNIASLKGEKLPLPRSIVETALTTTDQKFLLEIDFEGREWKRLGSQRKDTPVFEFHFKKIGEKFLFVLKDTHETSAQEEHSQFESRFYKNIYRLSLEIVENLTSSYWEKILDTFVTIFPSTGYIVSISEVQNNEYVRIMGMRGIDQSLLEKANNLMGGKLFSLNWHIPSHFSLEKNMMLSGKLCKISGGLQELFFYSLNPMISMMIEHIVGIHEIYGIGLSKKETIYGLLVVIIQKGHSFPTLEWLEPFAEEVTRLLELRKHLLENKRD